jgi:hypothetical protein
VYNALFYNLLQIYGGYYTGFGAIWTRADFGDHDWWCSKLSSMLVTGSQLGWFSLAGNTRCLRFQSCVPCVVFECGCVCLCRHVIRGQDCVNAVTAVRPSARHSTVT